MKSISKVTRSGDWRYSFIPQIFGNLYLWLVLFNIRLSLSSMALLFYSLITSFGFAALGYFINEYFDQQDDAKAGKLNKLSQLSGFQKSGLFISICLATGLPWFFLKYDLISLGLIALQVLLFVLYASPPFRFKKIAYLAACIDSLYAYVIPLLLSMHTYYLFTGSSEKDVVIVIVYGVLMMLTGIRNIVIHYINDRSKDKQIGFVTLPGILGLTNTNRLLLCSIYIEFALVALLYAKLIDMNPWFVVLFLPFIFLLIKHIRQLPTINEANIAFHPLRHTPDLLYQYYQPIFVLIPLLTFDWHWIVLVPFHLLLFIPAFRYHPLISWFERMNWLKYYIHVKQLASWVVNYSIFYCFLLIGVNLRKRNQSAVSFIKQKLSFK